MDSITENGTDSQITADTDDAVDVTLIGDEPPRTPLERVQAAASDLRDSLGEMGNVEVVENAPAVFVTPEERAVFLAIIVREAAQQYDLEQTQFNNGEICLEAHAE